MNGLYKTIFSGFGHEQTRADRDRHVRINFGVIQRSAAGNFKIIPHQHWDSLGTRYETRSVMHYGSYAGSFSNTCFSFLLADGSITDTPIYEHAFENR